MAITKIGQELYKEAALPEYAKQVGKELGGVIKAIYARLRAGKLKKFLAKSVGKPTATVAKKVFEGAQRAGEYVYENPHYTLAIGIPTGIAASKIRKNIDKNLLHSDPLYKATTLDAGLVNAWKPKIVWRSKDAKAALEGKNLFY